MTFDSRTAAILNACDGEAARRTIEELSGFHRVQASRGYRCAAEKAIDLLRDCGMEAELLRYPARLGERCLTQSMFREWNCDDAWLDISFPYRERAADFCAEPMSLIQRSAAADASSRDVPILYVADSVDPCSFDTDLNGKLLFVENGFERWVTRARELHAAGIVTVSIPDIPPVRTHVAQDACLKDAHGNLSFHCLSKDSEQGLVGFAVSPACAQRIKAACLDCAEQNNMPTARYAVMAAFSDGWIENVSAYIPGTSDEEILLTAHLCHPSSCVNDNISGVAVAIEAMRVLQTLVACGTLEQPKRTIRLLLIPEFTGTYAYIAAQKEYLHRVKAAINIDMIGAKQDGETGPILIVDTPDAAASLLGDVCEAAMDMVLGECVFGSGKVPLFMGKRVPFTGGSDHEIWSDPTVGVPSVAITQWPDKRYHTSADDAAHIDLRIVARAAAVAASTAYSCASFDTQTADVSLRYTWNHFFARSNDARRAKRGSGESEYLLALFIKTLDHCAQLYNGEERELFEAQLEDEKTIAKRVLRFDAVQTDCGVKTDARVPVRLYVGLLSERSFEASLDAQQRQRLLQIDGRHPGMRALLGRIMYETDAKRTVSQIEERIYFQTGKKCGAYMQEMYALLEEKGLVRMSLDAETGSENDYR